jgi:hypothetical protein
MNEDNPIVNEVHEIREQMLAEFGGDLRALVKDLQRRTAESAAAGREVVSMPPRASVQPMPAKKVG